MLVGAKAGFFDNGAFNVEAVTFDGSNDYLTRGSDLTGNADGKELVFSCWIKFDDASPTGTIYSDKPTGSEHFITIDTGKFVINFRNDSGVTIFNLRTSNTYGSADGWIHLFATCDLAATTGTMYINGVEDVDALETTLTNDTINFAESSSPTSDRHPIGANTDPSDYFDGDLAEVFLAHEYINPATNLTKFRSSDGKPVDLGADGSLPTGNQPIIYLSNRPGDAASAFATNRGDGGNFTVTGALATASTSPSD